VLSGGRGKQAVAASVLLLGGCQHSTAASRGPRPTASLTGNLDRDLLALLQLVVRRRHRVREGVLRGCLILAITLILVFLKGNIEVKSIVSFIESNSDEGMFSLGVGDFEDEVATAVSYSFHRTLFHVAGGEVGVSVGIEKEDGGLLTLGSDLHLSAPNRVLRPIRRSVTGGIGESGDLKDVAGRQLAQCALSDKFIVHVENRYDVAERR